jgi:threonine/homoserine/homoserine lactone efflux protein
LESTWGLPFLTYWVSGLSLGLSAAASPGPYQAYVIGLALRSGWRRALPAAFAPLVTDGPIIALVLLVLTSVPPMFLRVIQVVGGVFVLYLALKTVQAYRRFQPDAAFSPDESRRSLV